MKASYSFQFRKFSHDSIIFTNFTSERLICVQFTSVSRGENDQKVSLQINWWKLKNHRDISKLIFIEPDKLFFQMEDLW